MYGRKDSILNMKMNYNSENNNLLQMKSDESILGIQVGITSGCAIFYRGEVQFAASEERFTKCKNETDFPHKAIHAAIEFCKISSVPLPSLAVLASENMNFEHYLMRRESSFSVADYIREQREYWFPRIYENRNDILFRDVFPEKFASIEAHFGKEAYDLYGSSDAKLAFKEYRRRQTEKYDFIKNVEFLNHEYAHAAYAAYATPEFDEHTLVVTIDGFGDEANCSLWRLKNGKLNCLQKYNNFNVGRIYRYITLLLAMKPSEHEYKVMGLAPYSSYEKDIRRTATIFHDAYSFENGQVVSKAKPKDLYFHFQEKLQGVRFDVIAAGLQRYTEEMIINLVKYWLNREGLRKLAISGGVSLNIKANLCLAELDEVEDIFVPASGGDESLCIGAVFAWEDAHGRGNEILPPKSMYLGDEPNAELMKTECEEFISRNKEKYEWTQGINAKDVANLLAQGKVIGRFSGRMEFGARSLGNRAILANPKQKDIIKLINSKIKKRDFWMPFTPSIIDYKASEYLINPKSLRFPFMTVACRTTSTGEADLTGALHPADLTARPQIVTKEMNKAYWDLIDAFHSLTGIGGLLNTSLNLSGLPICESCQDAFHVMQHSELDALVLGDNLITRITH